MLSVISTGSLSIWLYIYKDIRIIDSELTILQRSRPARTPSGEKVVKDTNNFEQPVLILGCPFSGMDQAAALLHKHGLWMGKTDEDWDITSNKHRYGNPTILNQVNGKILGLMKTHPYQIDKIPELENLPTVSGLKPVISGILKRQGYDRSTMWGYKDFRLSLMWPIWQNMYPEAKWIIVKRPHSVIVNNCLRIVGTRKISQHDHYWYNWCEMYEERLQALKTEASHVLEIDSTAVQNGEFDQLQKVFTGLGMTFDRKIAKDLLSPKYWGENMTHYEIN